MTPHFRARASLESRKLVSHPSRHVLKMRTDPLVSRSPLRAFCVFGPRYNIISGQALSRRPPIPRRDWQSERHEEMLEKMVVNQLEQNRLEVVAAEAAGYRATMDALEASYANPNSFLYKEPWQYRQDHPRYRPQEEVVAERNADHDFRVLFNLRSEVNTLLCKAECAHENAAAFTEASNELLKLFLGIGFGSALCKVSKTLEQRGLDVTVLHGENGLQWDWARLVNLIIFLRQQPFLPEQIQQLHQCLMEVVQLVGISSNSLEIIACAKVTQASPPQEPSVANIPLPEQRSRENDSVANDISTEIHGCVETSSPTTSQLAEADDMEDVSFSHPTKEDVNLSDDDGVTQQSSLPFELLEGMDMLGMDEDVPRHSAMAEPQAARDSTPRQSFVSSWQSYQATSPSSFQMPAFRPSFPGATEASFYTAQKDEARSTAFKAPVAALGPFAAQVADQVAAQPVPTPPAVMASRFDHAQSHELIQSGQEGSNTSDQPEVQSEAHQDEGEETDEEEEEEEKEEEDKEEEELDYLYQPGEGYQPNPQLVYQPAGQQEDEADAGWSSFEDTTPQQDSAPTPAAGSSSKGKAPVAGPAPGEKHDVRNSALRDTIEENVRLTKMESQVNVIHEMAIGLHPWDQKLCNELWWALEQLCQGIKGQWLTLDHTDFGDRFMLVLEQLHQDFEASGLSEERDAELFALYFTVEDVYKHFLG